MEAVLRGVGMKHDPIDSLIYLARDARNSLEGLSEQIASRFGFEDENEDVAFLNSWIESIQNTIKDEANAHFDGRAEYSTGVPFMRCYQYPTSEPGEHGETVLVTGEAWVDMHPDGSPERPYDKRGVWVDKKHF